MKQSVSRYTYKRKGVKGPINVPPYDRTKRKKLKKIKRIVGKPTTVKRRIVRNQYGELITVWE